MSKITITRVGGYVKNNADAQTKKYLFNYVVTGGDVKQYIADKTVEKLPDGRSALSLQDNANGTTLPEHIGLPRFVTQNFLGESAEIDRVKRKDGTFGWFADDTEQLIQNSLIDNAPAYIKAEAGKIGVMELLAKGKAIALAMKADKIAAELANSKVPEKDLKKS